jgi:hypothetical protein
MASDSNRTDALFFTLRGNAMPRNAMPRNAMPQMMPQMMTPNDESRANALRVDSLLTSYIDTQFLLIEYSLKNLLKQGSTRELNEDDAIEFGKCQHMFISVRGLIDVDEALGLHNAARVRRVSSLVEAVFDVLLPSRQKLKVDRENALVARPQAENTRQNVSSMDRKQLSPKAEGPPQRDPLPIRLSDSDDDRYRRSLDPRSVVRSEKQMAHMAEVKATLARRNEAVKATLARRNEAVALASGPPTEACFQTLNPYVV